MQTQYQQLLGGAFDLVCFDLETNGFETDTAIVEIGAIKIKAGMLNEFPQGAEEFHSLIAFDGIPNPDAFAVHKISLEVLQKQGSPLRDVLTRFTQFTEGAALLGQNVIAFDLRILNFHLARHSLVLQCPAVFDTKFLARKLLNIPSYSLQSLVSHLGVDHAPTHRSLDDVIATIKVFQKLLEKKYNIQ
ncbi:MAG: 3'-5' exonuclease [Patescibacteria group bacterium]